jgi:prevent-host-death family protein
MPDFTVHQAKARLSELLAQARDGEDVVIAVDEEPVARIVPVARGASRRPGVLKRKVALTPAFFEPLPAQEAAAWGEGD